MDLRCPNCNSTNLKSLSVAFQEGRSSVNASSRLRGVVVGEGGPDIVIGRATTRGRKRRASRRWESPRGFTGTSILRRRGR